MTMMASMDMSSPMDMMRMMTMMQSMGGKGGKGKGKKGGSTPGVIPEHAQCYACGEFGHGKADCPHAWTACEFCGKMGHTKAMCHAAGNGPEMRRSASGW